MRAASAANRAAARMSPAPIATRPRDIALSPRRANPYATRQTPMRNRTTRIIAGCASWGRLAHGVERVRGELTRRLDGREALRRARNPLRRRRPHRGRKLVDLGERARNVA